MELHYKPDWEQTKKNYISWWNREDFGRCGIDIKAPKAGLKPQEPPKLPLKIEDRWMDFDYLKKLNEYRMSTTFYGGEAIPVWNAGYAGQDSIHTYLGCKLDLMENTAWRHPFLTEGELTDYDFNEINISQDNKWWVLTEKILRFAIEDSKGKSLPGIPAIGASGDTLSGIRDTENLLIDCMECPEYVRKFDLHLLKIWMMVFDKFYNITENLAEGSTNWLQMWAPGRFYIQQCDFAYMISPKMFREIFLPGIEMQTNFLDYSLYHLDGEGNFNHVDALCELPKLHAIQVLPGEGKPGALHYMDILKKVQSSGKNLQIYIKAEEVEAALENLSSLGLFLIITDCETEEHAKYLIKQAEKWSKVRKL